MFAPVPVPIVAPTTQHVYNRYEQLDPDEASNQFVAGEGTYKAIEVISLAHPAPHPSEPAPNPNPLTPHASPLHTGMHLSVISLDTRTDYRPVRMPSSGEVPGAARPEDERQHHPHHQHHHHHHQHQDEDSHSSTDEDSGENVASSLPPTPGMGTGEFYRSSSASTGGGGNGGGGGGADLTSSITATSSIFDGVYDPHAKRKKRTGTSANGTTSSFVSRAILDPNLQTRLAEHRKGDLFVFANMSRCLSWLDMGSPTGVRHDPLSKLLFSLATVVCHDVNEVTSSIRGFDVVLGTTTGDICWYDPATTRYLRFNKQRCINPSAVTQIQWLPGSRTLFMAAHADGCLVIYDKEREDVDFLASLGAVGGSGGGGGSGLPDHDYFTSPQGDHNSPHTHTQQQQHHQNPALAVLKSAHDGRGNKTNPVSCLSLSRQSINAFCFAPDGTHLAVVTDEGCLKIIDYRQERLLDVYGSYFGGLTCVAWSPDGAYIATGGKDDLVTLWSFTERRIVARCHGHASFVTGVSFDPIKCDAYGYRVGSIAEDGRLCLWDFTLSSLHRPSTRSAKHAAAAQGAPETGRPILRPDTTSTSSAAAAANNDKSHGVEDDGLAAPTSVREGTTYHRVESRLCTAILSPITVCRVEPGDDRGHHHHHHDDGAGGGGGAGTTPSHLVFLRDRILIGTTGKRYGRIKTWLRPV